MFSELFLNLYHHRKCLQNLTRIFNRYKGVKICYDYRLATISYFLNTPNFDAAILHRSYCLRSNNSKSVQFNTSAVIFKKFKLMQRQNEKISSMDYVFKHSLFKDRCIYRIINALECSGDQAFEFYKNFRHLFHENIDNTLEKINLLKDAGIPVRNIVKNVEILELNKDEIIFRLNEFDLWGLSGPQKGEILILMNLEYDFLVKISTLYKLEKNRVPKGNRLIYFSEMLECSLEKLVNTFLRHSFLFFRDFEKLHETLKVLVDTGISTRMILSNIWLCLHNVDKIRTYLHTLNTKQNLKNEINKAFLLQFQKIVENGKSEKLILTQHETRAELLSEKLNVNLEIIEYLMTKHSRIFNGNLESILKIIEFLLSVGYTGKQICTYPKVLKRDIVFLQKRLMEMRCHGEEKLPLTILSDTEKRYQNYLKFVIEVNGG